MALVGLDTSCTDSLHAGRLVRAFKALVAEACYRRLITPRGMLRGGEQEANYGFDVSGLIGAVVPSGAATLIASLPGQIKLELVKDERVEDVATTVTSSENGAKGLSLGLTVRITTDVGAVSLLLAADSVTVALLGVVEE
jgi:hypothetical protein